MCRSTCRWHTQSKVDLLTSRVLRPQYLFWVRVVQLVWHTTVAVCIPFFAEDNLLVLSLPYICYVLISIYFAGLLLFRLTNRMVYKQLLSYGRTMMIRRPLSCIGIILWVLFETVLSLSVASSILYWALVFPYGDQKITWWHMHLSLPMPTLFEFMVNHVDPQLIHISFVAVFAAMYVGFVYLYHRYEEVWLYPYFNNELGPLWAVLAIVICCILHAFFCQLARCKPRAKASGAALLKQPLGSTDSRKGLGNSPGVSTMSDQPSPNSPQEIEMESCSGCV